MQPGRQSAQIGHSCNPKPQKWPWCRVCHTPHPPHSMTYVEVADGKTIPLCPGHAFMDSASTEVECGLCNKNLLVRESIFTDIGYACRTHQEALRYNPPLSPIAKPFLRK